MVYFGPRAGLGGYLLGSGHRYVVLAHQLDGDSCQMLPLARRLAAAGFRAFAFDDAGVGSSRPGPLDGYQLSDDVLAAVAWARTHDATSVSLVGASMGGYGVLDAALRARPAVDAVVSLSGPSAWDDPRGRLLDISGLVVPTQLWASRQDPGFGEAARRFARQDGAAELHLEPGAAHGVDLVPAAFSRISGFLDAHFR